MCTNFREEEESRYISRATEHRATPSFEFRISSTGECFFLDPCVFSVTSTNMFHKWLRFFFAHMCFSLCFSLDLSLFCSVVPFACLCAYVSLCFFSLLFQASSPRVLLMFLTLASSIAQRHQVHQQLRVHLRRRWVPSRSLVDRLLVDRLVALCLRPAEDLLSSLELNLPARAVVGVSPEVPKLADTSCSSSNNSRCC